MTTKTAYTFDVPLPPPELSPNARVHWGQRSRATAQYREMTGWLAKLARNRKLGDIDWAKCQVSLVFCTKGGKGRFYQPRDEANAVAAFKAGYDGIIVDAGFARDDSAKFMEMGPVTIDSTRGPWVEVTIEEAS